MERVCTCARLVSITIKPHQQWREVTGAISRHLTDCHAGDWPFKQKEMIQSASRFAVQPQFPTNVKDLSPSFLLSLLFAVILSPSVCARISVGWPEELGDVEKHFLHSPKTPTEGSRCAAGFFVRGPSRRPFIGTGL